MAKFSTRENGMLTQLLLDGECFFNAYCGTDIQALINTFELIHLKGVQEGIEKLANNIQRKDEVETAPRETKPKTNVKVRPLVEGEVFRAGDLFRYRDEATYVLATVSSKTFALINLQTGNRFCEPVKQEHCRVVPWDVWLKVSDWRHFLKIEEVQ